MRNRKDVFAPTSIDLLKAAGLNFDLHKNMGIDPLLFGEHMFTHGSKLKRLFR